MHSKKRVAEAYFCRRDSREEKEEARGEAKRRREAR